jgi:dCTP deaminase
VLADRDIKSELNSGRVVLDPCDLTMLQPSSIDVRLDNQFCWYKPDSLVDPRQDQALQMEFHEVPEGRTLVIPPLGFVLGSTVERITLPNDIAARFEGKSSIGRLGLLPHVAAGFIDPGFSGWVTLELHNVTSFPFVLIPGMKIGQLCFFRLLSPADIPYGSSVIGSRYQDQRRGPTTSRFHLNYASEAPTSEG